MRLSVLMGAVSQGLLWSILAIGVYITYKILDYADLTTEGSYPLGAAVAAQMILSGFNPFIATFVSIDSRYGSRLCYGVFKHKA